MLLDGVAEALFGQAEIVAAEIFLAELHVVIGSSPRRPGFESVATGSPLGPGSAGCTTTVPVVSLRAAAGSLGVSLPFDAHRSLSFADEEQPPSAVRHAATTIKTRTTRMHINALRTTTRPAKIQTDTKPRPSRPRAERHRTSKARRRWLRIPRREPSSEPTPFTVRGQKERVCAARSSITFPWRGKVHRRPLAAVLRNAVASRRLCRRPAGWGESAQSAQRIPASQRTHPVAPPTRRADPPLQGRVKYRTIGTPESRGHAPHLAPLQGSSLETPVDKQ